MTENILNVMNKDMETAFDLMDSLDWKEEKPRYNDLKSKWITPPQGESKDSIRTDLRIFLKDCFPPSNNNTFTDTYSLHQDLLKQDFVPQKEKLKAKKGYKKANFIVLQGTSTCGLQYFIAHQHDHKEPALVKCIKADSILPNENNFCEVIWNAVGEKLGFEFDDTTEILTHLKIGLKEEPIAIVFYNVQVWGYDFLQKLQSVADFWKETKLEIKPFYCYFVCFNLPELTDDKESDVIILPPVECLTDKDLKNLYLNNDKEFCNCPIDIQKKLSGNLKLHDVIEIFCKHSTHRQELYKHFEQYQYFS
jgi:hypothetical protein